MGYTVAFYIILHAVSMTFDGNLSDPSVLARDICIGAYPKGQIELLADPSIVSFPEQQTSFSTPLTFRCWRPLTIKEEKLKRDLENHKKKSRKQQEEPKAKKSHL